jgi:hypothetical protein
LHVSNPLDFAAALVLALLIPVTFRWYYRVLKGDTLLFPRPWVEPPNDMGPLGSASVLLGVYLGMMVVWALLPLLLAVVAYLVALQLVGHTPVAGTTVPIAAAAATGANGLVWLARSDRFPGMILISAGLAWSVVQLTIGNMPVAGMTAPIVAAIVAGVVCLIWMAWVAGRTLA